MVPIPIEFEISHLRTRATVTERKVNIIEHEAD